MSSLRAANSNRTLFVFGAGGHGKVVAETASNAGWSVSGFMDDRIPSSGKVLGLPVIGRDQIQNIANGGHAMALGIGNNVVRMQLQRYLESRGVRVVTILSPHAVVSQWSKIGTGTVVIAGVIVNADVVTGDGVILNTSCVLEHDCKVGDFAHLSPNCSVGGAARVGSLAHVGIGATLLPGISIGTSAVLGGGAVATRDIPDRAVAYGVPARVARVQS